MRRRREPRRPIRAALAALRRAVHRFDREVFAFSLRARTRSADRALKGLSRAADNAKLWYAIAAALSLTGKRRPRTAAASGLLGVGISSALVNGPLKFAWRRNRPPAELLGTTGALLPLPASYSFPSGHAGSAFAFGTGVSVALPGAAPALLPLAGTVAYSRVHLGVHYPSDAVAGAMVGSAAGFAAARVVRQVRRRRGLPRTG